MIYGGLRGDGCWLVVGRQEAIGRSSVPSFRRWPSLPYRRSPLSQSIMQASLPRLPDSMTRWIPYFPLYEYESPVSPHVVKREEEPVLLVSSPSLACDLNLNREA
jgi:hypothetical protein